MRHLSRKKKIIIFIRLQSHISRFTAKKDKRKKKRASSESSKSGFSNGLESHAGQFKLGESSLSTRVIHQPKKLPKFRFPSRKPRERKRKERKKDERSSTAAN